MCQRDARSAGLASHSGQKTMAQLATGGFEREPVLPGVRADIRRRGMERKAELQRKFADPLFVQVGGAAAQAMVEMRDFQPPAPRRGELPQRPQEHHRVHPAGDTDDDSCAVRGQAVNTDQASNL